MTADQASTAPADLQQTREQIARQLADETHARAAALEAGEGWTGRAGEMRDLAAALTSLDRALERKPAPVVAPLDVDQLCADVWNRLQEVGHPTSVSDDAVDAIRLCLEGRPPALDHPQLIPAEMDSGAAG